MKKEIVIEFERIRIIYNRGRQPSVWCASCQTEVEPISLKEAREVTGAAESFFEFVNQGKMHLIKSINGETLICLNSLSVG